AAPHHPPDPASFLPDDPDLQPGALLALLRADLALRREAGDPVRVERYCYHFTNLPDDVLVALLYEEFCLREEAGETPDPAEYQARFPAVAKLLREVLDIHALVVSSRGHLANGSTLGTLSLSPGATVAFPEAGQLIGGFRLVEELGRGTFA